jgi:hypothetical protein
LEEDKECRELREVLFGDASVEPSGMEKVFVDTSVAVFAMV